MSILGQSQKTEIDRLRDANADLRETIVSDKALVGELKNDNEILKNKVGDLVLQLEISQLKKAGGLYDL